MYIEIHKKINKHVNSLILFTILDGHPYPLLIPEGLFFFTVHILDELVLALSEAVWGKDLRMTTCIIIKKENFQIHFLP